MKKKFNTTGTCYPESHYMMDNRAKLDAIFSLIENGEYFVINRPRQYGKTTSMYHLFLSLQKTEEYLPIKLSFQGIDRKSNTSDEAFAKMFINQLYYFFTYENKIIATYISEVQKDVNDMNTLSMFITHLMHKINKRVILFIDEVDASSNYQPFLSFLGMLRTKYLDRAFPQNKTFHSIVLIGVHDIKNLKFKLRASDEVQYNSPWNIAANFEVDMSFNPEEIAFMLRQYSEAENISMDIPLIAQRLHYHTSGYPFLVSRLCQIIATKILPKRKEQQWTLNDIETVVQMLLKEDNPNFDSVIQHLKNHEDLYQLVFSIIINGNNIAFNPYNSAIQKGITYGIFKSDVNHKVTIHNHIYQQHIYNFLVSNIEVNLLADTYNHRHQFLLANNELDIRKLLLKFQQFIKEQYSDKDRNFLEREWRLLFLAFIQPVLNGGGYAFKEPQFEQEKQLDVVITYHQHRYIIELKKWYGQSYHEKGIKQLANYLNIHGLDKGYLVIFDNRKKKTYHEKDIEHQGKGIFAVWV